MRIQIDSILKPIVIGELVHLVYMQVETVGSDTMINLHKRRVNCMRIQIGSILKPIVIGELVHLIYMQVNLPLIIHYVITWVIFSTILI